MTVSDEHVRWDALVDSQLRLWHERDKEKERPAKMASKWDRAHVTISRQYGARGYAIGQLVAQKLGWEIYSRNLVEHIAEQTKLRDKVIAEFDEKKRLATLTQLIFDPSAYNADKHYRHLIQVILSLTQKGRAVIVGRGANFIAGWDNGLHVRVVASLESRIRRYAEKERVTEREARKKVESMDHERAEFIRHYFHADIENADHYDMIINVEHLSNEQVADMIISALEIKLCEPRPEPVED